MSIQYRSEHDSVGERSVPKDVYYGVQSLRAAENFPITGLAVHPEQINSIAEIKKASAITNLEIGLLDKRVADAIVRACDEIAAGRLHEAFIVDPIQGGAGTSLNMNANEVIANRAIELLGVLNQAASDRQILAQRLGISPQELTHITNSGAGEGLLFFGDKIIPFVDKFPTNTRLYKVMTTKPADLAA